MELIFDRSFLKSLDKINSASVKSKVREIITTLEAANNLTAIGDIKKIKGFSGYYRIRIGDYRLGIEVIGKSVRFMMIAHRKEIYRYFP